MYELVHLANAAAVDATSPSSCSLAPPAAAVGPDGRASTVVLPQQTAWTIERSTTEAMWHDPHRLLVVAAAAVVVVVAVVRETDDW